MNEECDRCAPPKRADYILIKGAGMLTLCGPCVQQHYPGLSANGWEISPLTRVSTAPQLAS